MTTWRRRADERCFERSTSAIQDVASGGLIFVGVIKLAQVLSGVFRVSCATPILAPIIGLTAVFCGGASAGAAIAIQNLPSARARLPLDTREGLRRLREMWADPRTLLFIAQHAAASVCAYKLLRGRFSSLLPSDLRFPGAFSLRVASLPATLVYAEKAERASIQAFGRLLGCHSCGGLRHGWLSKRLRSAEAQSGVFIADHMPTVKAAKRLSEKWWWRAMALPPPTQRFYAQCLACRSATHFNVHL